MHNYGDGHAPYNAAVRNLFETYVSENRIDPASMTQQQAERFVQQVRTSNDPAIRDFNRRVLMRAVTRVQQRSPGRGDE
jgi:hypothetical protein